MINKRTKIVATISDLNCEPDFLRSLHDNGVDVVRLNTAHQTFVDTKKIIDNVRSVSKRIALLVDTKGPEIRTTKVEEEIVLKENDLISIQGTNKGKSSSPKMLYVNYVRFAHDVPVGANILIDDGELELVVKKKKGKTLICQAVDDGEIKSNKSINLPGISLNLPSLSQKDKDYIKFAVDNDLDFIAHSFVRNAKDVMAIQKILDKSKSKIKIIAKIENKEGVDNIDEILDHVYGIMVARGDLSIEIPTEQVPLVQKALIKKCIARQKPIITATQMLHTMIKNPRPTRAEVSDIANAVLDGTDALMLSGETAYGKYPLQSVKMMSRIAVATESQRQLPDKLPLYKGEYEQVSYLAQATVRIASQMKVKEIIVSSNSGASAELISAYRGLVPVFVKCSSESRIRELAMSYGVNAHLVEAMSSKKLLTKVLKTLVKKGKLKTSDSVIYLANDIETEATANFMEICKVGKYVKEQ